VLVVGVDQDLAQRAGDLADELRLRAYDAVHLASAMALGTATTFISWDADLSAAAHARGLAVAPAI
jgi:predicted nucleic acid-binding protein